MHVQQVLETSRVNLVSVSAGETVEACVVLLVSISISVAGAVDVSKMGESTSKRIFSTLEIRDWGGLTREEQSGARGEVGWGGVRRVRAGWGRGWAGWDEGRGGVERGRAGQGRAGQGRAGQGRAGLVEPSTNEEAGWGGV